MGAINTTILEAETPPVETQSVLLLETRALSCMRGDRLLFEDLSFTLAAGALLQIEGPNGSGKTSLLRILAGLVPADAGEVRWRGHEIHAQRPDFASELLYIGHLSGINPTLTPLEYLRTATRLGGENHADAVLLDALADFGLAEYVDTPARRLSEGQRRRTALARLLVSRASLWLLDEPLSALDADARSSLEQILVHHGRRGGVAVFSTHQAVALDDAHDITHLRLD